MSIEEMTAIRGIGPAKAVQLRAGIELGAVCPEASRVSCRRSENQPMQQIF